mgnify:CR=1 FL=1
MPAESDGAMPRRILFHHRIRSKDGQYVHLSELRAAFEDVGCEVHLVGPRVLETASFGAGGGATDGLRARLPGAVTEALELAYALAALPRLVWAIVRLRPDFVYERFNLFFPIGALACRLFGIPYALEINSPLYEERAAHGGIALHRVARWSQRTVWRHADLALPVTRVLADTVERYGADPSRILVLHNGVDRAHFHPRDIGHCRRAVGLPEDALLVGFVGFVRDWHRVDRVIDALASGRLPAATTLAVVGDGPAVPALRERAARLGVADRVVFAGLVPRDRIADWVGAFDVALQPAVTAYASPLKLIEYLACGKTILAPAQPNITELLEHDRNALLFDDADDNAFSDALQRLCGDASLRARLAAEAGATIDRLRLTWLDNARRIVDRMPARGRREPPLRAASTPPQRMSRRP